MLILTTIANDNENDNTNNNATKVQIINTIILLIISNTEWNY